MIRPRVLARRLPALLTSLVLAHGLIVTGPVAPAAAATCGTTVKTAYSATVCLTAPNAGSAVSGDTQVSATVSFSGTSPGVRRMIFNVDNQYVLTDFGEPYTFALPTAMWVDGAHSLQVSALLRDGVTTTPTSINLTFVNGTTTPPTPPADFVPRSTAAARPVLAASGDGPDGGTASDNVASLISSWNPDLALYLGDVYEKGTPTEFHNWYGATGWGALAPITNPVIGNHEYENGVAPGYFGYWRQPPHYYAFNAAGWRVLALDSTSQFGQTGKNSDQYRWLESELASAPACTMAYFHHPVYSIGPQGDTTHLQDIWRLLVDSGVDLVLTGHDHSYQRWLPLDRDGNASASGLTHFVVGTAGHGIQAFARTDARVAAGFDSSPAAYGALKLTLNPAGAGFLFADTAGVARDGGAVQCRGTAADTAGPSAVTDLSATAPLGSRVELQWTPSVDNVGISEYRVLRDGQPIGTTHDATFRDYAVVSGATYQYRVVAVDPAGNESAAGNVASVTLPADGGLVFVDDFETGTLAKWTTSGAMSVDGAAAYAGSFGARAISSAASPASAWTQLTTTRDELYYRARFKVLSKDANSEYLLRFRTGTNASLLGLYVSASGKLGYRNDASGASNTSGVTVTTGVWHEVQVRVSVAGAQGSVSVWYDGAAVPALTRTEDFGTVGVRRLQIGDNASGKVHEATFDAVRASLSFIDDSALPPQPDETPPGAPGGLSASATAPDRVTLAWSPATDDVGVTGYDIYRSESSDAEEGLVLLTTIAGASTGYVDVVAPQTTYQYQVRARDEAGNVGPPSNTAATTTPAYPTSGTFTFTPVADAYVDDSTPTLNFGTATTLRIDNSPQQISYLRFDLNGIGGIVSQVRLRLHALANGTKGCNVHPVANTSWSESGLIWTNAPARGPSVAGCGAFSANNWVTIDLTSANLVSGNGMISLAVTNPSSTSTRFSSREGSFAPELVVVTREPDTTPPSPPANLQATATSSTAISLSWQASTDDVGVTAYQVTRNGTVIATVSGTTLTYLDGNLSPSTTYLYRVSARDAAGNPSNPSNEAIATTQAPPSSGTFTFTPVADAYVDDSTPGTNFGTATVLRIDNSPQEISYLRFDLNGIVGTVSQVQLRLYALAKGTKGCNIHPVANTTWSESTLIWTNAPARGASVAGCGSFSANTWITIDLTSANLVAGNGALSLAVTNPSSTSTRLSSREGSFVPELVVVTVPAP